MSDYVAQKITNESYIVGNTRYYMEYLGRNHSSEIYYQLINQSVKRPPLKITTDNNLTILKIGRSLMTQEEQSVCKTKGMSVPVYLVMGPNRYKGFFPILFELLFAEKEVPDTSWNTEFS